MRNMGLNVGGKDIVKAISESTIASILLHHPECIRRSNNYLIIQGMF